MPRHVRLLATLSQVSCDHRSEMVHPTPNRLGRHRQSAFRQQILDVARAEGEPEVEPYRLVNDLGREPVSGVADFLHPLGYSATGRTASTTRRDNARQRDRESDKPADPPIKLRPRSPPLVSTPARPATTLVTFGAAALYRATKRFYAIAHVAPTPRTKMPRSDNRLAVEIRRNTA